MHGEGTSYHQTLNFVSFSTIYARRMSTMTALSRMGNLIVWTEKRIFVKFILWTNLSSRKRVVTVCAFAMILNSIGLVVALSQKDRYKFLITECVLKYVLLSDNCTATLPARYNLASYWKNFWSQNIPRRLPYEVIMLCDRLAHVEHHVQARLPKNQMLLQKIR